MMLPHLKSFFVFTRTQRSGIAALFFLIFLFQALIFSASDTSDDPPGPEELNWLALQKQIDSIKAIPKLQPKTYPFNPNFITDFKGYSLGMSVAEIDRLHEFRKKERFVNSAAEFQDVTLVSDSLLAQISPNFKFPDWVKKRKPDKLYRKDFKKPVIAQTDINTAVAEELIKIYGIGPALSERILAQREKLGGFVSMKQMDDIWGLSPEVVSELNKRFLVGNIPQVKKVQINSASLKELSQFPYFRYPISKSIITFRSMNGKIKNSEDLLKIPNFPVEKVDLIAVYLEF